MTYTCSLFLGSFEAFLVGRDAMHGFFCLVKARIDRLIELLIDSILPGSYSQLTPPSTTAEWTHTD
jgi:hypothetical protein